MFTATGSPLRLVLYMPIIAFIPITTTTYVNGIYVVDPKEDEEEWVMIGVVVCLVMVYLHTRVEGNCTSICLPKHISACVCVQSQPTAPSAWYQHQLFAPFWLLVGNASTYYNYCLQFARSP